MSNYSISTEAARILNKVLLQDPRLHLPDSFVKAAEKIKFVGEDDQPFILTPLKITESSAALNALVATAANVVVAERYGINYQNVEINTDLATLFLESVLLPTIGGKHFMQSSQMLAELAKMDLHQMSKPIRRYATNVYRTKDGRWYHLHGSMNALPTMEMLGVEDSDVSTEEAFKIYTEKVAEWDSQDIEKVANEKFKQAGVICYTPDEFFASEHGKIMSEEPLWTSTRVPAPKKTWPEAKDTDRYSPLAGIKVLDLSRVIAAPAVSKILSVLGADVIRVSCSRLPEYSATMPDLQTGKRDVDIDLKTIEGRQTLSELIKDADVLVDGYRPGALAKLGFDSKSLRATVLPGKFLGLDEAVVPLFPNSDYQTGLVGAAAAIQALLARTQEDVTFDIDISLTQYNIWYYRLGSYSEDQQKALRNRDPQFSPRHYDDMSSLVGKTHQSLQKIRPEIVKHPEYFWDMSGKEYGLDEDFKVLAPAFKFEKSSIGWDVPTGRRGRSKAEWVS
ncbi:acyl transferase carnitine dehydratase [Fusarium tjaetaba]|uniref:Acyl transferase carnitine dehydratase n=1 Tax=Fusarium tjaetaba TaxID=1567544 RepID=A0A8H5VBY2_9HYPO|nr:acyl transferase carnitine dehydratase [Fusarium tjaetaba]KAF5615604.1 acyl transferase carnitine dehydratase [Fusarium tjaetaba]